MRPETAFWSFLRERITVGHVIRIENGISSGLPDVNWCVYGHEVWIELKITKENGWEVLIRKQQRIWGLARSQTGHGNVFIVALNQNDAIYVWKYPNIEFEKADSIYQRIVSTPHFECHKTEVKSLIDFMLYGKS